MSALRILLVVLLLSGGLGGSLLFASKAVDSLHASPLGQTPTGGEHPERAGATKHPARPRPTRKRPRATRPGTSSRTPAAHPSAGHDRGLVHLSGIRLALLVAIELAVGVLLIGGVLVVLVIRRVRHRSRRTYALYELHLSTHDEAKAQDLEDMVESIANVIHAFPGDRARSGQPFVALELICGAGQQGTEWSINLRCEPRSVRALDAAISAAYPDVRLGRRHAEAPLPRPGRLRVPGCVMRFRKERSFIYPLVAAGDELSSPPLEAIAHAQVVLGVPSVVRFQLTPAPTFFEALARALPPPREPARAPGALGTARGRPDLHAQPSRDGQRRAHAEPQPVLARDHGRRRHARDLQAARRRRAGPPRREPAAPPLDDRAREPLPPPLRHRHTPAPAVPSLAGLSR